MKSTNTLPEEKFEARIGDFGLAKVIDMPKSKSMLGSYDSIALGKLISCKPFIFTVGHLVNSLVQLHCFSYGYTILFIFIPFLL